MPKAIEEDFEVFSFDIDSLPIESLEESALFNGEKVKDVFSVIARIVRTDTETRVYVPRAIELFRQNKYRSTLQVILV